MKKIEKLEINFGYLPIDAGLGRSLEDLQDKINEIIDFLNKLDSNTLKFHED